METLLRIAGLKNCIKYNNVIDSYVIGIDANTTIEQNTKWYQTNTFVNFINILYKILIFSIITWSFVAAIILSIKTSNQDYVLLDLFNFLTISIYIYGIFYFNGSHFNNIQREKEIDYTFAFYGSIIPTTIVVIIYLCLLFTGFKINIYNEIYFHDNITNIQRVNLVILMIIDKFFSYLNYFLITNTFILVMSNHTNKIKKFAKDYTDSIIDIEKQNLASIMNEFSLLRDSYGKTVNAFNKIFPLINIIGSIACFFIVSSLMRNISSTPIIQIINIVIFISLMLVYYIATGIVESSKGAILNEHKSHNSISKYFSHTLSKISIENFIEKPRSIDDTNFQINENIIIPNLDLRNNQLIESSSLKYNWKILKDEFKEEWIDFTFFSVQLKSLNIIQKIIMIILSLIIGIELSQVV